MIADVEDAAVPLSSDDDACASEAGSLFCDGEDAGAMSATEMDLVDEAVLFLINHQDLTVHAALPGGAAGSGSLVLDGVGFVRRCRPSATLAAATWQVSDVDPGSCYASCGHEACRRRLEAHRLYG